MTGLPKSIIKKYGVTRKAWQVFRSGRQASPHKSKSRGSYHMAKRRHVFRRIGKGVMNKLSNPITGAIAVIGYKSFIEPMIPVSGLMKDIAGIGIGAYASNSRNAWFREGGKALMYISAYNAGSALASGMLGIGGGAASATGSYTVYG